MKKVTLSYLIKGGSGLFLHMADAIQRDGAAGRRNRVGISRRVTKKPSALLIFFKGSIIMVNVEKVVDLHNAEEWRSRNGEKKS